MKSVLGSLIIFVVIMIAYWTGLFDLFSKDNASWWALVLVVVVVVVGYLVLGSPWGKMKAKDDENEEN